MRVEVRNGNVDKAIRVLKNKLQKEGVFNELREREYYMTKGEKRRKAKAAAIRRQKKLDQKRFEEFGFQKIGRTRKLFDYINSKQRARRTLMVVEVDFLYRINICDDRNDK